MSASTSFELAILSVYVFILAGFLGLELVRRVSPLLHTPLMSLTNALSSVAVVAALVVMERMIVMAANR